MVRIRTLEVKLKPKKKWVIFRIRTLDVAVSNLPQMSKLVVDRSLEFLTAKLYFFIFVDTKGAVSGGLAPNTHTSSALDPPLRKIPDKALSRALSPSRSPAHPICVYFEYCPVRLCRFFFLDWFCFLDVRDCLNGCQLRMSTAARCSWTTSRFLFLFLILFS